MSYIRFSYLCAFGILVIVGHALSAVEVVPGKAPKFPQAPGWSQADYDFFLHGSMSTEFALETVLRTFIRTYRRNRRPT